MNWSRVIAGVMVGSCAAFSGCSRGAGPAPEAISVSETDSAFKTAFAKAAPDLKSAANLLAQAMSSSNYTQAHAHLTVLLARPDLTPDQRQLLARSQITVMQHIRELAAGGDAQSGQVLQFHRSSK